MKFEYLKVILRLRQLLSRGGGWSISLGFGWGGVVLSKTIILFDDGFSDVGF